MATKRQHGGNLSHLKPEKWPKRARTHLDRRNAGRLGAIWRPSWGRLGAILGHLGAILGHLVAILGSSKAILSDLTAKRLYAQIATKTERKTNVFELREPPKRTPKWHLGRQEATSEASWGKLAATCEARWQLRGNMGAT